MPFIAVLFAVVSAAAAFAPVAISTPEGAGNPTTNNIPIVEYVEEPAVDSPEPLPEPAPNPVPVPTPDPAPAPEPETPEPDNSASPAPQPEPAPDPEPVPDTPAPDEPTAEAPGNNPEPTPNEDSQFASIEEQALKLLGEPKHFDSSTFWEITKINNKDSVISKWRINQVDIIKEGENIRYEGYFTTPKRSYHVSHKEVRVYPLNNHTIRIDAESGLILADLNFISYEKFGILELQIQNNSDEVIQSFEISIGLNKWTLFWRNTGRVNQAFLVNGFKRDGKELYLTYLPQPDFDVENHVAIHNNSVGFRNFSAAHPGKIPPKTKRIARIFITAGSHEVVSSNLDPAYAYMQKFFPEQPLGIQGNKIIGSLFIPWQNLPDRGRFVSLGGPLSWTPAQETAFKLFIDRTVNDTIKNLKRLGSDKIIFWDSDGSVLPHGSELYVGPADDLHPLMDKYIDSMFQRWKEAGFRVGILVRVNRGKAIYDEYGNYVRFSRWDVNPQWKGLLEVMEKANTRWGVDMFYMDSMGHRNPADGLASFENTRKIKEKHPNWLLIPENEGFRTPAWAHSIPYFRPAHRSWEWGPDPTTKKIWPNARAAIDPEGLNVNNPTDMQKLEQSLLEGNVILIGAHWSGPMYWAVHEILRKNRMLP